MNIVVRHAEPADAEAIHAVYSGPLAVAGTLRAFAFRNGHYVDAYAMARVRMDARG